VPAGVVSVGIIHTPHEHAAAHLALWSEVLFPATERFESCRTTTACGDRVKFGGMTASTLYAFGAAQALAGVISG